MSEQNHGFPLVLKWSQEIRVETPEELALVADLLEDNELVMPDLRSDPDGLRAAAESRAATDWEYVSDVTIGHQETHKTSYTSGTVSMVKQVCRYTREVQKELWRNTKTGQTKQTCLKYSAWELDQCIENPMAKPFS